MKKLKIISVIIGILLISYIGISWFLLDGRIIYTTSYNENTIRESKEANLFITDNLEIKAEGDSLVNWKNKIDIWTNKRYKIKYFGIFFHWTYTRPEWRYLNIQFKNELYPQINNWCVKDKNEEGYSMCCNRIPCDVNETVTTVFYKCKEEIKLGSFQIVVK